MGEPQADTQAENNLESYDKQFVKISRDC